MTNGFGSKRTTIDRDMAAHDRLPALLRFACANAVAKWSSEDLLRDFEFQHRAKRVPAHQACQRIIACLSHEEPEDTYRAYGPDHPEADNHGRRLRPAKFAAWGAKAKGSRHD